MGRFVDLTGQNFGRLAVVGRAENAGKNLRWTCRCTCGNTVVVHGGNLRNGHTKSCGCLSKERTSETKLKDLTGRKFGRLIVVSRAENSKKGAVQWNCICDCGNATVVLSGNLRSADTKSCGCLNKEQRSKRTLKDLTGQPFGRLTVVRRMRSPSGRQAWWGCICECGNTSCVPGERLRNGDTQSCGCLQKERAAERLTGENHHSWRGGITPENEKIRSSAAYSNWRTAVFERDDYTCQMCGQRGGKLNADHIKPFATHPDLRFDIDNGRTLCEPCHRKTDTYGSKIRSWHSGEEA